MTVKDRVRKHRAKLRSHQWGRLDAWVGVHLIEKVRKIAKANTCPMWAVVQEALEAYVSGHDQTTNTGKNP